MKRKKKTVSLSLDEEIIAQIKTLAHEQNRSLSRYVNHLLRFWLEMHGRF